MGAPVFSYNRGLQLAGKPVGTILIQLLGPVDDRNYFASADPIVHVQVFGTGEVQVQENATFVFRGENSLAIADDTDSGNTPVINVLRHAPRGVAAVNSWATLGAVIDAASGLVTRTLTPLPTFNYIQLVVTGVGTGKAAFATDWN